MAAFRLILATFQPAVAILNARSSIRPASSKVLSPEQDRPSTSRECWEPCGERAGRCDWCGIGRACCRRGSADDPEECKQAHSFVGDTHECVSLESRTSLALGDECWTACGKGGYCASCGVGGACCRKGFPSDPEECGRVLNFSGIVHECVKPATSVRIPSGTDCWHVCGGGGLCTACGGNDMACCRQGFDGDPSLCRHVSGFRAEGIHECVAVGNASIISYDALELGDNCWAACGKSGRCAACGGDDRACCRQGWPGEAGVCARAAGYYTDHHECVEVQSIGKIATRYMLYASFGILTLAVIFRTQSNQEEALIGRYNVKNYN